MIAISIKAVMIVIRNREDSGASLIKRYLKAHAAMMLCLKIRSPVFVKPKATINFALKKIKLKMESLDHSPVHQKIQACAQRTRMYTLRLTKAFSKSIKENLHGIERCPHKKQRTGIANMSLDLIDNWFKIKIKVKMDTYSSKLSNMVSMSKYTSLFKSIKSSMISRSQITMT